MFILIVDVHDVNTHWGKASAVPSTLRDVWDVLAVRVVLGYFPAMANTAPLKYKSAFTMRVDEAFLADLDNLRAAERPIMSRAEYLRKLVDQAKAAKARAGRRK